MRYEVYIVDNVKPCPFCGADAVVYRDTEKDYQCKSQEWVECKGCGATGPIWSATRSHGLAIKYWNKRVEE